MITGIGHVAFRVTDLGRALDFYCGTLGFREAFRLERDGEPSPWIVYLQVAPGQFLELFPGGTGAVTPRSRAAGYNHYCLVVDDLRATLRELEARGLTVAGEPVRGQDLNWQFWIEDPDGNAIELMEVTAASPQAAADAAWD
jgi:catechol 2,3-dioxygenase-like lactoylglutathione lyase family enzyme